MRIDAVFGASRGLASGLTKAQTVEGEDNQKDYYDTWYSGHILD